MREELAGLASASANKWSAAELAKADERAPAKLKEPAPVSPEDKLAAELADELSRVPEDSPRNPQTQSTQPQHLFVGHKRKLSSQQLSTSVVAATATATTTATAKRQRRSADKNHKQPQAPEACFKTASLPAPAAPETQKQAANTENVCAACCKPIHERYLLVALDKRWHEDCLKCACCDCRLAEVGSSLFLHSDKILCRRDFARIFGPAGTCAACKQLIPPHEMVMRAHRHAYHMDCFRCLKCQRAFCVGDPYYLNESQRILCVECHELADAPTSGDTGHANPLEGAPQPVHAELEERPEVELLHQVSAECASS